MMFHNYSISEIQHGPKTIMDACGRSNRLLAQDSSNRVYAGEYTQEISASNIQTQIIQIVGRFCERYASDVLCELAKLDAFIRPSEINKEDRWVIGIGIREDGVDGNTFIMSRLRATKVPGGLVFPEHDYRKVLAIDIRDVGMKCPEGGPRSYARDITLMDISGWLYKLNPEDEKEA